MKFRPKEEKRAVRCAIYTRKSTEEGLEQDYNTLDAQRDSGESFIKSQASEGWVCLPVFYDDGGFTGANMDRPALKRLIADIEAGLIDCVVVYKVDRLSRSLLDFGKLMELFDKHGVSFISVTQSFNTATSMGRLMLNVLLSFAQFEREMISERTRDKIAATRRKGKWSGGRPLLGYDVVDTKLVVNEAEVAQVRQIFQLYLAHQALMPVLKELEKRGWRTKQWTTKKETACGGQRFDKARLYGLLTNVAYIGKVRYKTEVHDGEHPGIVDPEVFAQVQSLMQQNRRTGGAEVRLQHGAILRGLVRCTACGCSMIPAHTTKGTKRYRYYTCTVAQKKGWHACPSKSIPAEELERFVVDQIRDIGKDPALVLQTLVEAQKQGELRLSELELERDRLDTELTDCHDDLRRLATEHGGDRLSNRLADLQERIRLAEQRLTVVQEEVGSIREQLVNEDDLRQALAEFDPVWQNLNIKERARVLQLLIARIDFDGHTKEISLTFHPTGIKTLLAETQKEVA